MDLNDLGAQLFGKTRLEGAAKLSTTHTITGVAQTDSSSGRVKVIISDDVTSSEDGDGTSQTLGQMTGDTSVELDTEAAVKAGDVVTITTVGGELKTPTVTGVIGGGDRMQLEIGSAASDASAAVIAAQQAKGVADAVNQHFWTDSDGVHVTEVEQDDWSDPTSPDYHTGANQLSNSAGILLRDGLTNSAAFTSGAVSFFDGNGNDPENVAASFGSAGFQVGLEDESHLVGDYHALKLIDVEGDAYFHVSDLRDRNGEANVTEVFSGNGSTTRFNLSLSAKDTSYTVTVDDSSGGAVTKTTTYFTFATAPTDGAEITVEYVTSSQFAKAYSAGIRKVGSDVAPMSFVEGLRNEASGFSSHAEGVETKATKGSAHAEGTLTEASGGDSHAEGNSAVASGSSSHAEGSMTTASGSAAHAEGGSTTASGSVSHAEGNGTTALKVGAHAEGYQSVASGEYSHAEGSSTTASGNSAHAEGRSTTAGYASHAEGYLSVADTNYSHAQNLGTIAHAQAQTALGKYNVQDSTSAVIIGNGTADDARSNALVIDWNGDVTTAGDLSVVDITATGDVSAASLSSSGAVSGASLSSSGNASVGGDLSVSGALTLPVISTSTASDIATAGTNFTVTGASYTQWGRIATLYVTVKNTNALTAGTLYNPIATLVSGKHPLQYAPASLGTGATIYGNAQLNTSGAIGFRPSVAVSANSTITIRATYIVA